jgi:uncharacterized protein
VTRLGVISDTHGLMRREALAALGASDLIVHAGDVGTPAVLVALRTIAPVVAVRGNNDRGAWARRLPESRTLTVGGVRVHVIHDLDDLAVDLARSDIRLVVSGHSHRPSIREEDGVLFLNPEGRDVSLFPSWSLAASCARTASRHSWFGFRYNTRVARGGAFPRASVNAPADEGFTRAGSAL